MDSEEERRINCQICQVAIIETREEIGGLNKFCRRVGLQGKGPSCKIEGSPTRLVGKEIMIWSAKVLKSSNNFQGSTDSSDKTIWKNVHKMIKEYFEPFQVKTKIVEWRTLLRLK